VNKGKVIYQWIKNNYPYWVIWVGPLILFGSFILEGKVIFWGTAYLQFLPWRAAGWEQISNGYFPFWNSYNGYGTPLLANYQTAFFYPPNIIVWVFAYLKGNQGIAVAQTLLIFLHLVMAGYGMFFLTKKLGFSKLSQAISSIAYSLSGYLVSRVSFISVNSALAWIPWLLFSAIPLAKCSSLKSAITSKYLFLSILFHSLLLLAGHAQLAWYGMIFNIFWMLTWSYYYHRWSKILVTIGIIAIALGFSACLSAVQLFPTAEFLLQSQRASNVEYAYALNYSFWPWRFLTLISANLFGNPAHGDYWVTADNYWEDNIYTGVISIIFACVTIGRLFLGFYKKGSIPKTITIFSITTILLSIIFALGKYTPIFPFFYKFIPTFDMFQAPTRFSIWLVIAVSMLAGLGIEKWNMPEGKWLYWSRLLTAGGVGITVTSIAARYLLKSRVQETFINGITETGVLLSILLFINLFAARDIHNKEYSSPSMTFMILVFLIGDLVYANWGVNPGININSYDAGKVSANITYRPETQSLTYIDDSTEQKLKFEKYFRFDSFLNSDGWEGLQKYIIPNSNILDHITALNNFDPFIPLRYENLTKIIIPKISDESSEFNRFWAIGDVINTIQPPDIASIKNTDDSYRIRWFNCATPSTGLPQSIELLNELITNGDLFQRVVIEGIRIDSNNCKGSKEELKISDYTSNPVSIKLNVIAPSDGWLLHLNTNYPGWKVKIDGNERKVYYGDILFRAIKLTKGSHLVEFYYQPLSIILGLGVSFSFLCILIIFLILLRRIKDNSST
jgi:hypothetical protein